VFVPDDAPDFISNFKSQISNTSTAPLLTVGIQKAYNEASTRRSEETADLPGTQASRLQTTSEAMSSEHASTDGFDVSPSVFETSAVQFLNTPDLNEEIFGPTTLLIRSNEHDELINIANALEGQLTASIHGTDDDLVDYADLVAILETKVGRLIFNGFSTGVEVCSSMVHGGPYPATSDGRSTAVGSRAITRFARLVCYQNFPDTALPEELKEANPLGISRFVDGTLGEPLRH
jgi:2,5-dioxopentanoate dehydrogenase